MPFITEQIWQNLDSKTPIMASRWPHLQKEMMDKDTERQMDRIIEIIVAIRNIRAEMNIEPKQKIDVLISTADKVIKNLAAEITGYAQKLANANIVKIEKLSARPRHSASAVLDFCQIFIPLEGVIDMNIERERLNKKLSELESSLQGLDKKLSNKDFVKNAPAEVIEKEKEKQEVLKAKKKQLVENIKNLS
jgi:valyl-tRNA synthetase